MPYDRYVLRVDGSGRLTTRNRRFLRRFTPYSTTVPNHEEAYDCDTWRGKGSQLPNNLPPRINHLPTPSQHKGDQVTPDPDDPIDDEDAMVSESQSYIEGKPSPVAHQTSPEREKVPLCLRRLQPFLPDAHEEPPPRGRLRPRSDK